jgi:hypothetical protein
MKAQGGLTQHAKTRPPSPNYLFRFILHQSIPPTIGDILTHRSGNNRLVEKLIKMTIYIKFKNMEYINNIPIHFIIKLKII